MPIPNEMIAIASMFGCACMVFVCAAQLRELFAAARPRQRPAHEWNVLRHAVRGCA